MNCDNIVKEQLKKQLIKICEKYKVEYMSVFGSYGTENWKKGVSDIDIGIIHKDIIDEYCFEEEIFPILKTYFNYEIINLTYLEKDINDFLYMNIICGETLFSKENPKELKYEVLDFYNDNGYYVELYTKLQLEKRRKYFG